MTVQKELIRQEIRKLEERLEQILLFKKKEPQGCLKCQKIDNKIFYIHQYKDKDSQKLITKYIRKDELSLAQKLAQKQYYRMAKPILERNLVALRCLVERYHPEEIDEVYDRLSEERKKLVTPIEDTIGDRIRKWYAEEYEKNNSHPENLKFETQQGEMVRSKSEVIIANMLYQYKDELLYKYECPLKVIMDGKQIIIYPDFKVLNICTGKITYWEHAGRMDDPGYANDYIRKNNTYIYNDMIPGIDVIFTYETIDRPLDVSVVKKIIEKLRM